MSKTFDCDEKGAIIAYPLTSCVAAEIPGHELIVLRLEFQCEEDEMGAVQVRMPAHTALDLARALESVANANRPGAKN